MQYKTFWIFVTFLVSLIFVRADDLVEPLPEIDVEDVKNEPPMSEAKPLFKELSDVVFAIDFPKNPLNEFLTGEKVQVQVNFTNTAENEYILKDIYGFLIDPEKSTEPMANLTGLQYEIKISKKEEGNVPFYFQIPEYFPEKQVSLLLIADATAAEDKTDVYKSMINQSIITIKEAPVNYYDLQTFGIVLFGLGAVITSLLVLKKAIFGSKKKVVSSAQVDQKDFLPPNLLKTKKAKNQKSIKTQ